MISSLKKKLLDSERVIIYGASPRGVLVYRLLQLWGFADKVVGFAVTKKDCKEELEGISIYEIGELTAVRERSVVLISTLERFHEEISNTLTELGFNSFEALDCFDQLEKVYLDDWYEKYSRTDDDAEIDVLYFASDNNIASGAFRSLVDLNKSVLEQGISTMIVLPCYGDGERMLIENELPYIFIASEDWCVKDDVIDISDKQRKMDANAIAIHKAESYIKKHHVKVVHLNTAFTYIGAIAGHNAGVPVVWHIREVVESESFRFVDKERAIQLIGMSDRIIAISEFIKKGLLVNRPDIIRVIADTMSLGEFWGSHEILSDLPRFTVIITGAVAKHKRQLDLIAATDILVKKGFNGIRVLIVGRGDNTNVLKEEIRRLDLEEHIQLLGMRDDIQRLMQEADISVTASIEALGRTTIEAMAAGCLVIGANIGASPELIKDGETGYLFEMRNETDLASKIEYAITHVDQSRIIAKKAQSVTKEEFVSSNGAGGVIGIYRELLS